MRPALLFCIILFTALTSWARTITVDDDGFADFNNIQAAIDDAANGDSIIVANGAYTGDGNRDIDFKGKRIVVYSQYGPESCIIDCNGTEAEPHRGFYFHSGETAESVLEGITIKNGYASSAAGIACVDSSPTIIDCRIVNCTAESAGGGIYCGGDSAPTVTATVITGNVARWGAGLYGCGGSFEQCEITANNAEMGGGGLYDCSCTLSNCVISSNWAYYGSGIGYCHVGPLVNCLISGNTAYAEGGGFWLSDAVVKNCTVTGNRALGYGGGICGSSGAISDSIIWANTAPSGAQLYDCTEIIYSCIQDYSGTGLGNIDIDPCFFDPGWWDSNGTPDDVNDDTWYQGDYHLMTLAWRWDAAAQWWTWDDVTSRCIDAGNPGCTLADEPLTVPEDPLNEWGDNIRINMGRYGATAEASMPPYDWALLCDLTNDLIVGIDDLSALVAYWPADGDCLPGDLSRDQTVDFADLAVLGSQWNANLIPPPPPPDTTPPSPEPNIIISPDINTVNPADNSLSGYYKIGVEWWHKIVADVASVTDDSGGPVEIRFICVNDGDISSTRIAQFGSDPIVDPDGDWTIFYEDDHIIYDVYVKYGGPVPSRRWKVCAYDPSDNKACSTIHTIGL